MANPKKRVPEYVPGDFFVDTTCIDCDACRQVGPAVFGEAAETSFVKAQPVASADQKIIGSDSSVRQSSRRLAGFSAEGGSGWHKG